MWLDVELALELELTVGLVPDEVLVLVLVEDCFGDVAVVVVLVTVVVVLGEVELVVVLELLLGDPPKKVVWPPPPAIDCPVSTSVTV